MLRKILRNVTQYTPPGEITMDKFNENAIDLFRIEELEERLEMSAAADGPGHCTISGTANSDGSYSCTATVTVW